MLYFGTECNTFQQEIEFAAKSLFRIMNVEWQWIDLNNVKKLKVQDFLIIYGDDFQSADWSKLPCQLLGIQNSHQLFGDFFGTSESMPISPFVCEKYVSLYRDTTLNKHYKFMKILPFDILADVFFMLSRYEEYIKINPIKRDIFGRFCGKDSIAAKYGFLDRPIVDEWALYLMKHLRRNNCDYSVQAQKKRAKLLVTHDIDTLYRYQNWSEKLIGVHKEEIKYKQILFGKNPYNNIVELADWEKRNKIKADYYFIPTKGENNADYKIVSRKIQREIRKIYGKGHEIGFHAGFYTIDNLELYHQEIQTLQSSLGKAYQISGSRQHYLRNAIPDTFIALEKEGICYDTTLAFADMEGFRCGTCHPFRHYNIYKRREIDIWEIPLIFMDVTLKYYRKYSTTILKDKFKYYYNCIKKHGGVLTILWHNNRFAEKEWESYNKVYCSYVKFLANNMQSCTGKEIISEYKIQEVKNAVSNFRRKSTGIKHGSGN